MTTKTQTAKKQPTKKQQERKAAAIAKRKEVSEKAAAVAEQIKNDPDTARRFAAFTARMPTYSPKNQEMIFAQFEGATQCAGFNKWLEVGRVVRKGERAIKIMAPTERTKTDEEGSVVMDPKTGKPEKELTYIMVSVFDVSQTEEITG
ncbi:MULTISPECIES: ArdC family protein [Kocuria]|uniref:ArdC family protein n=1 Tax=Kocuria TaxID=57493 RepID=UPI0011A1B27E|nr:ArdC family protein [Kocuria indica]MBN6812907.1 hypothetical protein [Kocuria indica]MBN6844556.1 hypothetical protein [Kocuria indica]